MNLSHPALKFLIVGGIATAIHYGVFFLLFRRAGVDPVLSTTIGFAVSAVFNFSANYRFTFRSRAPVFKAALRYLLVGCTGLLINAALFALLYERVELHYVLAQLLATGVVLVWNYLGGKHFTYIGT